MKTLDGQPNFRDLGGLRTRDGRRLRDGILYRSGNFENLSADGRSALAELNLGTVIDLRTAAERERHPTHWPTPDAPRTIWFETDDAAPGRTLADVIGDPTGTATREFMLATYETMPEALAPSIAGAFEVLAASPDPLLVHCTAGKDRTGVFCALLLTALEVEPTAIASDFAISDRHFGAPEIGDFLIANGIVAADKIAPASLGTARALPEYLKASLHAIELKHGSFPAYLRKAKVDDRTLEAASKRLLEPA